MTMDQFIPQEYRIADTSASGFPIPEFPSVAGMPDSRDRSEFGARLLTARKNAGLSQTVLAKAVGISQSSLAEAERGASGSAYTAQLAAVLNVDAHWLATGEAKVPSAAQSGTPLDRAAEESPAYEVDMDAHADLVSIRRVKLRLKAGISGFAIDADESEGTPLFFRSDWLRERGYKPYALVAVKVTGPSMEPSLFGGDMVVINTADIEPKDGVVFAVNYEGEAVIKRMIRDGGKWWLSSDNPDQRRYQKKECHEGQCIVVGRVVHRQSEQI